MSICTSHFPFMAPFADDQDGGEGDHDPKYDAMWNTAAIAFNEGDLATAFRIAHAFFACNSGFEEPEYRFLFHGMLACGDYEPVWHVQKVIELLPEVTPQTLDRESAKELGGIIMLIRDLMEWIDEREEVNGVMFHVSEGKSKKNAKGKKTKAKGKRRAGFLKRALVCFCCF